MKVKLLIREYNIHKQTKPGEQEKTLKNYSFLIRTNGLPGKILKLCLSQMKGYSI